MDFYDIKYKLKSLVKKSKMKYNDPLMSEWIVFNEGLRPREQAIALEHLLELSVKQEDVTTVTAFITAWSASRAAANQKQTIFGEGYRKECHRHLDHMLKMAEVEIERMISGKGADC